MQRKVCVEELKLFGKKSMHSFPKVKRVELSYMS